MAWNAPIKASLYKLLPPSPKEFNLKILLMSFLHGKLMAKKIG